MITKSAVRSDFKYIRTLLQDANFQMTGKNFQREIAEEIANELVAAATNFLVWVEEQEEAN